jgi:hypothetical protein
MRKVASPLLSVEDALSRIVAWLRNPSRDAYASRREPIALMLDVQQVLKEAVAEEIRAYQLANPQQGPTSYAYDTDTNAGPFHSAAWELCRRGILRPRVFRGTSSDAPAFGTYFDVTPYGQESLTAVLQGCGPPTGRAAGAAARWSRSMPGGSPPGA